MRKDTENWVALAEYDLETARHMLATGWYLSGSRLPGSNRKSVEMVKRALKYIITRYCAELAIMGIQVEKVLLYGSQARRTAHDDSDIDLIVISRDWKPYSVRERLEILGVASARILEPVQANGFTPDEISSQMLMPFWEHILSEQAMPI
jgi:predicted nucleotidyltransferase